MEPEKFIQAFSQHLKRQGRFELPKWADVVKTSKAKELPPSDPETWKAHGYHKTMVLRWHLMLWGQWWKHSAFDINLEILGLKLNPVVRLTKLEVCIIFHTAPCSTLLFTLQAFILLMPGWGLALCSNCIHGAKDLYPQGHGCGCIQDSL